jgi:hypothetical protein
MSLKYTDRPYGYSPQRTEDWQARFPANSYPMDSAPITARPIKVYEPSGQSCWAMHHMGVWRKVVATRDPYSGKTRTTMTSELVANPVRCSSS